MWCGDGSGQSVCGNGTCTPGQTCDYCTADGCCGNGTCDYGESCRVCSVDCGPCQPISPPLSGQFSCDDPDRTQGVFDVDVLGACTYRPREQRLDIAPRTPHHTWANTFAVNIVSFTGVGTYTTSVGTDCEDDTFVRIRGDTAVDYFDVSSTETYRCISTTCTITVTDAGVVSASPGESGSLSMEVDCPTLRGGGGECVLTPSTWTFSLDACGRDD